METAAEPSGAPAVDESRRVDEPRGGDAAQGGGDTAQGGGDTAQGGGDTEHRYARRVGLFAIILGVVGLGGRMVDQVFAAGFSPTLVYANLAAAVLELGLAAGLLRRSRAAWAFAVMSSLMVSVMNLFAWPDFATLGSAAIPSAVVAAARLAFLIMLVASAPAYRRTRM